MDCSFVGELPMRQVERQLNGAGLRTIGTAEAQVRKLIAFDEDTFAKLKQLGRDRMASFQELADEAFADLLKKHGIPVDLKDALRKSASPSRESEKSRPARRTKLSTRSQ